MFGYDAALRQRLIARFPGGTYKGTSVTYNRDGLPHGIRLPTGANLGENLQLGFRYTPAHAPDTLSLNRTDLGETLARLYAHDWLDRVDSVARVRVGNSQKARVLEYTTLGRLKSATDENHWEEYDIVCPDPDPSSCYTDTTFHVDTLRRDVYSYDRVGNRKDHGAVVDTANRVRSFDGYTLTYDNDGNVTSKSKPGVWNETFTWNALGQLVQVVTNGVTTTLGYDGWGRRVRKTVGTTRTDYVLDGHHVIAEVSGAGSLLRSYAYYPGVDRPHSVKMGDSLYYYVSEAPGHVSGVVNASNVLVNRYEYTAFGEAITTTEGVAQPLRFGAREYDSETKLYFHRARYYDPQLGRFISEDPIGLNGGINAYVFAANDPITLTDPYGLSPRCQRWGWAYLSHVGWYLQCQLLRMDVITVVPAPDLLLPPPWGGAGLGMSEAPPHGGPEERSKIESGPRGPQPASSCGNGLSAQACQQIEAAFRHLFARAPNACRAVAQSAYSRFRFGGFVKDDYLWRPARAYVNWINAPNFPPEISFETYLGRGAFDRGWLAIAIAHEEWHHLRPLTLLNDQPYGDGPAYTVGYLCGLGHGMILLP